MADTNPDDRDAWYVGEVIDAAKSGNYEDAREALRLFVNAAACSQRCIDDPDALLVAHVADCLRRYLEDREDLAQAFGLKRPRRRPKNSPDIVNHSVARAAAVELLRRHYFRKTQAVEAVAAASGVDTRTIMRDCRGWVRKSFSDRQLRILALAVTRSPNFPPLHRR